MVARRMGRALGSGAWHSWPKPLTASKQKWGEVVINSRLQKKDTGTLFQSYFHAQHKRI
jgi:hypothetical protein